MAYVQELEKKFDAFTKAQELRFAEFAAQEKQNAKLDALLAWTRNPRNPMKPVPVALEESEESESEPPRRAGQKTVTRGRGSERAKRGRTGK